MSRRITLIIGVIVIVTAAMLARAGQQVPPTAAAPAQLQAPFIAAATPEQAGRYFILIGGCNDCHTPGWRESKGALPEAQWLTGSANGFTGPWGTSYPYNLRLMVQQMSEEKWVDTFMTKQANPPMPWFNYTADKLNRADAVSTYRFIRQLGPAGAPAPKFVPPASPPGTP